ncbi:PAS domain S-box protein [Tenacibaculum sp. Mcav3-52]|uniref:PAS domain S-box protein n=1 Tax=Tenacibaculum sp. Mcav3-52 TaxID=2917762 RepID=UPI001EF27DBD|nr:PAS domain S-box protein [Tenacibaculum sp. Mcav3-52]MCG7502979.1 PAS domain S-box protein [Tenacibaculum sp. Mcav3-52]
MSQNEIEILKRALKREKAARKIAEKILEDKSRELFLISEKLKKTNEKLEELLNEKSSQLKGVFENINDSYLVMDLEGNVLTMNDAAKELFGYDISKEDLNVKSLLHPEDTVYAFESFGKLYETGTFSNYTSRIISKDKKVKWVQINASIIYNKKNEKIAAQGIIRNISESKRATELIEEQKRELDIIVENSSLGIALAKDGKVIRTNKVIEELLGYSKEEFAGLTIKEVSFKDDVSLSMNHLGKMERNEIDNYVIDKRYKRKDGSILWARVNVNSVNDALGQTKFQVAIIEDITLQRERALIIDMINELAKSILGKDDIYEIAWEVTEKIAEYLDSQDCVIYLLNNDNNTLEQIASYSFGLDRGEIIKDVLSIGEGIIGSVAKTGKGEIINDTSLDDRYVVGEKVRYSEIAVPIINEGKVIGVIDSEHEEKNYYREENLHTLENIASLVSMQLKSAINLREREKAEKENLQLLKQLEKSNNELNEYAHVVSHDLKSPLRSIDALVSWIKTDNEGKLDDTTLQNFNLIGDTLETMENLISSILEYSSAGSEVREKEEVDLNIIINNLIQTLYIPENIFINVLEELPTVKGDSIKYQQLFQNLISNAIKFSDKEKGVINISFTEKPSFYQFSVQDNGIGIEKKYHDRIFKIFHSLKESKESTGIGLSIVKKIVQLYGGTLWLESELGIGTTFYFTIKK